MNTLVWIFALLFLGLATGVIVGALLAFTRGRTVYDLTAGLLGAVSAGVMLRLLGSPGYRAPLPTLLVGVAANPHDAWQVYGVSKAGQVFGTQDGGISWVERRLPEGVGDCYAIACG